jgi:hypothetical protein
MRPIASAFVALASITLAAIGATGCTATVTPNDPTPAPVVVTNTTGSLTVDWTINGTKDPNQCSQGAASAIEIRVTDSTGASAGVFQQSCTAFATSVTLGAGSYTAEARLLDANGAARTTAVLINAFTLRGDDDLDTPIDFGADSFL